MKNLPIIILSVAVILLGATVLFSKNQTQPTIVGSAMTNSFDGGTSSAVAISTNATSTLSSANANRRYVSLYNDGSNTIYCTPSSTSTSVTAGKGIRIAVAGSVIFDGQSLYVGQLFCLTSTGTSSLSVYEK